MESVGGGECHKECWTLRMLVEIAGCPHCLLVNYTSGRECCLSVGDSPMVNNAGGLVESVVHTVVGLVWWQRVLF